ncbi:4-hydroxybenzoate polyprenyltransferase [Cronobacter condimenti 1330]|uniref:4-hydroxybenzoate octaprenyltransferase n=1 Tax=Cronobacter condimenti 1330 TaxID=1073999 RepID=K8A2N5_9ENTR|nr:4-hydroxybenzoate octaprenyltransferase [Cronobacter condimenti]ALB62600.1 4-hydroxybenzoate polyprenyltransferase [Cronobacter condimenti 1330]CCJ73565.1 4-hydroxybenzoate polyprenyltransferase [Cronobacter condimenti 1330]
MAAEKSADLSDIHHNDWVDRWFSPAFRPYLRLARVDRPVGIWLTLFPCIAALFQAAHGWPALDTAIIFCLGAFLMRSAGSTINDIADRHFDAHVERTRFRPLASGTISVRKAIAFFVIQLLAAASLLWFLTPLTRLMAVCVVPLVILYPFCKRFTYWPQAILGAAFNWGMLMAWTQINGTVPAGALLMWLGTVAWQIAYDTAYAYADAQDDKRIGLKSTALLFGEHGKMIIAGFYLATLLLWSIGGALLGMSWLYALGMVIIAAYLLWQTWHLDLTNRAQSFNHFLHNILTGVLLALAALAGTL